MTDDYPTEEQLAEIRAAEPEKVLDLASAIWWQATSLCTYDLDNHETVLQMSTGGWSGNESVIEAMMANSLFWATHWLSTRRGGHYVFLVAP